MFRNSYVLVTPARDEEAYIEKTIQSVISQTILPKIWVIVSDGSKDRTDEIVKRYEEKYDFIKFLHRVPEGRRNFGSKVHAIRAGITLLNGIKYSFIGILDADVSFEPNYYESVLQKFNKNPKLGIAGGMLLEACSGKWIRQLISASWSVSGPIQMFRRQCYKDINGYIPAQYGGEDAIAEIMARMYGWEVKSFPELSVFHHRLTGTENQSIYLAKIQFGMNDYSLGYLPSFEIARCIYRVTEKPYVVGAILILSGYIFAFLRRHEIIISSNVRKYLRQEQTARLKNIFRINRQKTNS